MSKIIMTLVTALFLFGCTETSKSPATVPEGDLPGRFAAALKEIDRLKGVVATRDEQLRNLEIARQKLEEEKAAQKVAFETALQKAVKEEQDKYAALENKEFVLRVTSRDGYVTNDGARTQDKVFTLKTLDKGRIPSFVEGDGHVFDKDDNLARCVIVLPK